MRGGCRAIAEGYEINVLGDDQHIRVRNPDFQPDDGSNPWLLIDARALAAPSTPLPETGDVKAVPPDGIPIADEITKLVERLHIWARAGGAAWTWPIMEEGHHQIGGDCYLAALFLTRLRNEFMPAEAGKEKTE